MLRRVWIAALVVIGLTVLSLTYCRPHPSVKPSPAMTRTVFAWMRCVECTEDQQAYVVALGDSAVPFLRSLLLDGPPASDVDRVRRHLDELKTPINGWRAPTQAALDATLEDYVSGYRIRSAIALGDIRTGSALSAVCEAKKRGFARPGVRKAIDDALAHMPGPCP